MINEKAIRAYVLEKFRGASNIEIRKLGSGVQGSGFLVEMQTEEGRRSYVVKSLLSENFGHDYASDRAAVFLQDLDEYSRLPRHVHAVDVLAELNDETVKSVGGGREYYLMMEKVEGTDYFKDLHEYSKKKALDESDMSRITSMSSYLADIHHLKKESKPLYWRKLRDTVGHGECLMGVFDIYPDGTMPYEEMADIIKRSVDWVYRLKPRHRRLSQIHGDFHPGNIWFKDGADFIVLDRSRGPWGEPADDLTALAINYIFFSIMYYGNLQGSYLEGLKLFIDEYIRRSGDTEILEVTAPFFAFRCSVVANPVFYPELSSEARRKIFNFARGVLSADRFYVERVNDYLSV